MPAHPTELSLDGNTLTIRWSDGERRLYDVAELRRACPCAACRGHHGVLPTQEAMPDHPMPAVGIKHMAPVGNYAYRIEFSDGHDTGLFTLEYLRQLGRPLS